MVVFLRFFGEQFDPRTTGVSLSRGFFERKVSVNAAAARDPGKRRSFRIEDLSQEASSPPAGNLHEPPNHFDPLHIEDPLQPNNNVGRNVFRIRQIQKVFGEAAEALRVGTGDGRGALGCLISWSPREDNNPAPEPKGGALGLQRSNSAQTVYAGEPLLR
jgi:hypothetical protein